MSKFPHIIHPPPLPRPAMGKTYSDNWRARVSEKNPLFHIFPPEELPTNVESEGYALFLPADFEVDGRSEQLARAQVPAGQIYILHTWSLQATRLNAAGQAEQLVAGALAGKILWQLAISHREKGVYPTHVEFRPNSNAGVVSGKSVLSSVLAPDGPLAGEGHSQLREYGYFKCGFSPIIIQPGSQIWINVRAIATNVNVGEVINALGCQFYGSWRGYSMNV